MARTSKLPLLPLSKAQSTLFWTSVAGVFLFLVYLLKSMLMPFAAGFLIAYIFRPLVKRGEAIGLPRALSSALIIGLLTLLIFALFFATIPFIKSELFFLVKHFPEYGQHLFEKLGPLFEQFSSYVPVAELESLKKLAAGSLGELFHWMVQLIGTLFNSGLALVNVLSLTVIAPVVAFYLLRDWNLFLDKFDNLVPRNHVTTLRTLFKEIDKTLGSYARGQLLVCTILAVYYSVALKLIGMDSALIVGILTGFLAFVPYVGFLVGLSTALLLASAQFSTWASIGVVGGIYAGGQVIESFFLVPHFVGHHTGLHPVWVLFALFAGGVLGGFTGVLLALPVAATLGVCIRFMVQAYLASPLYETK